MILDQNALDASIHLVGRTGATSFEIGYLNDGVPVEAAEALARRLLDGAK